MRSLTSNGMTIQAGWWMSWSQHIPSHPQNCEEIQFGTVPIWNCKNWMVQSVSQYFRMIFHALHRITEYSDSDLVALVKGFKTSDLRRSPAPYLSHGRLSPCGAFCEAPAPSRLILGTHWTTSKQHVNYLRVDQVPQLLLEYQRVFKWHPDRSVECETHITHFRFDILTVSCGTWRIYVMDPSAKEDNAQILKISAALAKSLEQVLKRMWEKRNN